MREREYRIATNGLRYRIEFREQYGILGIRFWWRWQVYPASVTESSFERAQVELHRCRNSYQIDWKHWKEMQPPWKATTGDNLADELAERFGR